MSVSWGLLITQSMTENICCVCVLQMISRCGSMRRMTLGWPGRLWEISPPQMYTDRSVILQYQGITSHHVEVRVKSIMKTGSRMLVSLLNTAAECRVIMMNSCCGNKGNNPSKQSHQTNSIAPKCCDHMVSLGRRESTSFIFIHSFPQMFHCVLLWHHTQLMIMQQLSECLYVRLCHYVICSVMQHQRVLMLWHSNQLIALRLFQGCQWGYNHHSSVLINTTACSHSNLRQILLYKR